MAKIEYEEIGFSERTGNETTKHLWDWNPVNVTLTHYIDGILEDEFTGDTAKKTLKILMG